MIKNKNCQVISIEEFSASFSDTIFTSVKSFSIHEITARDTPTSLAVI